MITTKTYTAPGTPFDALAFFVLLIISLMVAIGVFGVCREPGGAMFFLIGSAIVTISIYPVVALFVAEPWRLVVATVSGLVGAGIYVCALDVYYRGEGLVWDPEYYWTILIFLLLSVWPAILAAATLILVGHNIEKIPLTVVSFGVDPSAPIVWRLSEAYRRKAIERRSVELHKEEQVILGETALIRAKMEAELTSAKTKYLNSLTESERATLQLRMDAVAHADLNVERHVKHLRAENAELRQMLAQLQAQMAAAGLRVTG